MKGACMEIELDLSLRHPAMIRKALINAGASMPRQRIRPTRQDFHGGRSDEFLSRLHAHRVPALRDRFEYMQTTHLRRSAGRRGPLQEFESELHAQKPGNRGKLCESRRGSAPLDTRAIPKAARPLIALSQQLHGDVGLRDFANKELFLCQSTIPQGG